MSGDFAVPVGPGPFPFVAPVVFAVSTPSPQSILVGYNGSFHSPAPVVGVADVAIYFSIGGGPAVEANRFKAGFSGGASNVQDVPFGGTAVFLVPGGPTTVEMLVSASPGGAWFVRRNPVEPLSMSAIG
ncbi:MAG: hypothetical protein ACREYE_22265 [Gammaproteobacteria bacterium]